MVEKQFKRHYQLLMICIVYFISYLLMVFSIIPLIIVVLILLLATLSIMSYSPNDFLYWIEDNEDYITITYNGSIFTIDKGFTMNLSNSKKYLVLEDNYITLSIPYSYEVVKFLREINN